MCNTRPHHLSYKCDRLLCILAVALSLYILPIYSPMTPIQISWTPDTKHTIQVVLVQPIIVFPSTANNTAHSTPMKLITAIKNPNPVIMCNGFAERLIIPSKASPSILERGLYSRYTVHGCLTLCTC